jgi:signal transduction histidine kinase
MNGPVVPAASPESPARSGSVVGSDRRLGAGARLGFVLLAPARSLAFFGLSLAGLVLLVAAIGPVVLAVDGLGHVLQDISRQGFGGQDADDLRNALIGLACCRFVLPGVLVAIRRLASLTRRLAGRWCNVAIHEAYAPEPVSAAPARGSSGGLLDLILRGYGRISYRQRMTWLLSDRATWKDLLWLAVSVVAAPIALLAPIALMVGGTAAFIELNLHGGGRDAFNNFDRGLGAVLAAAGVAAAPWTLRAYAGLARLVLAPSESSVLEQRVAYLALTRQESLDTGAAELRRIERDLHDGAQARLVAMGMSLGAIEHLLERDPQRAKILLSEARESSSKALTELRDLVRGIHPPVLAERGLGDAVRALAMASPLRTEVSADIPGRIEAPVESAAYFAVSEILTNAAKHSGAQRVWLDLRHEDGMLRIVITDDGQGGADVSRGTGISGIERRIGTFDGLLALSSPAGGPTMVTMELPCELSPPQP